MTKIWADCLIAGVKVWSEVPEVRKADIKQELIARVASGEITEERMNEIIGV